jgi:hypothetical protein
MIPPDTRLAGSVPCLLRPELAETKYLALDLRVLIRGFWAPAAPRVPHAQPAGVQKASRREVAGRLAPAGRRALWRFDARAGSMGAAPPERGDLHACQRERARERDKRLSRLLEGMSGRRAH